LVLTITSLSDDFREAVTRATDGVTDLAYTKELFEGDFIEVWGDEWAALEGRGECEIPAQYSATGNPVIIELRPAS